VTGPFQGPPNGAPTGPPSEAGPLTRPDDVDTGFWLWLVATAMMVIGYVVDLATLPVAGPSAVVYGVSGVFLFVVASVVVTFLFLMREGYSWARTLLTGGGAATIVYALTNLFGVNRPAVAAFVFAVTAIVGAVCVAGGIYLLHRKDAHAYFTR
jgi:peptidoglycan/LPS O-acetylase OafA/YrhL